MKFENHRPVRTNLSLQSKVDFTESAQKAVKKAKLVFFRLSQL
jgi:hypothetical protein